MNLKPLLFSIAMLTCSVANAQGNADNDKAYITTVTKRSDKILAGLQIADSVKYKQVREIMVQQYVDLNDLEQDKNDRKAADDPQGGLSKPYQKVVHL